MGNAAPNAALLIIGDEILSGNVTDVNAPYLARELWTLGVSVQRIVVVPDDAEEIAREIAFYRNRFTWILTSGGIGPTPDDVTLEGVAQGLGVALAPHPDLEQRVKRRYGSPNAAQLKLADVPLGAALITSEAFTVPLLYWENIFIFPGVPDLLKRKFNAIKSRFQSTPFHRQTMLFNTREDKISWAISETGGRFPDVRLGSYPRLHTEDLQVEITFVSKDAVRVDEASRFFLNAISPLLPLTS